MVNEIDIFLIASLVVIVIAVLLALFVGYKLFRSWRESGQRPTLYMAGFFVFFVISVLLLLGELQVVSLTHNQTLPLTIEQGEFLGYVLAVLAVGGSVIVLIFLNLFALSFLGEKYRGFIIIPVVIGILYWLVFSFAHIFFPLFSFSWVPELQGDVLTTFNMARSDEALLTILLLMAVPVWFPPLVLAIATIQLRKGDRPVFLRSLLMTISFVIVAITYIFEIIEVIPALVPIIRLGFVIFPIMMYLCLLMPEWFKRLLGFPT
ncbi:MAG: hypothetical protein ACFFC7_03740 [Candidatus Hermodarchaeota archaeon]